MTEYIFAVDSDGCAMDTMTYKHELFFGPLAADIYEVEDKETFQKNWEEINLYSKTRGVNRFVGLVMGLDSVDYQGHQALKNWVENADSLSNDALKAEIEKNDAPDLKKALEWSEAVNKGVSEAEGHDKPFPGAKEGLAKLKELGKVYIVSSANPEAIDEEWNRHGLMEHVDDVYAQDRGKKKDVIAGFIADGADPKNIMMVGDSPGDLDAGRDNGAWFFPIIVGQEEESWDALRNEVADKFVAGEFTEADQKEWSDKFWNNLEN